MKKSENQHKNGERKASKTKVDFEDDVDALFRLQLAEFTGARNTLAAQLKKSGRGDEAALVKALVKPSISAWAVNQLYWNHREVFDRLIASGERFHEAQTSRHAGKIADMRKALDARREMLTHLSELATSLLRDAGHNPSLDTIRRLTTTLEAMSVCASGSDVPPRGRLTQDVDPPGFESFGSFTPGAGTTEPRQEPTRILPSEKSKNAATKPRRRAAPDNDVRQIGEMRKAKIAAAKGSLQDAKRSLTEARLRARDLEAAQKKAYAEEKKADQHRRDAEQELRKAKAAAEDAAGRARSIAVEVKAGSRAVDDAEGAVEKASKELQSLVW